MKRPSTIVLAAWCLSCVLLLAHLGAQAVDHNPRQTSIVGLCGSSGDPAAALGRIATVGATSDKAERDWAERIIAAVRDGAMICTTADQAVLVDGDQQRDAVTLQPLASKSDASPFVPGMVVKRKLAVTSAELNLFNADSAMREQAAAQIDKFYTLLDPTIIADAVKRETAPSVKATLALALAKRGLQSDLRDEKLRSIAIVADVPSQASRTLLSDLLNDTTVSDPALRAAAATAIATMDRWLLLGKILSVAFSGLSYAGILLLTALGLSVVFGLMGVINLAHGEFIMIGAYATYVVEQLMQTYTPAIFGAYIFVAIPFAFIVCALLGMLLEFCVIRFLYHRPLETLLATWAVSIAVIKLVQLVFGAQNVEFITPAFLNGGAQLIPGFFVTYNRIFSIALALAIFGVTLLVIRHTSFGLLIRATTQLRDTARCLGVATERVDRLAFGMGAGLAGLAGVVLTQIASVNPSMGTSFVVDAFMVVVLGGAGSLIGTAVSSLALGEINQIIEPLYGSVAAKVAVLLLIVLIIQRRPQGLFVTKARA